MSIITHCNRDKEINHFEKTEVSNLLQVCSRVGFQPTWTPSDWIKLVQLAINKLVINEIENGIFHPIS